MGLEKASEGEEGIGITNGEGPAPLSIEDTAMVVGNRGSVIEQDGLLISNRGSVIEVEPADGGGRGGDTAEVRGWLWWDHGGCVDSYGWLSSCSVASHYCMSFKCPLLLW